tara:strand:+ start:457 stop:1032 length:576 start_codon:yes stop_codon:yes gene_type:complete
MALSRDFYIPKGATKIAAKDLPVVFYAYDKNKYPSVAITAMCFIGKQNKPAWHYSFKTHAMMEKYVADQIESVRLSQERKAKEKAERLKPHSLKVGDVMVCSWGYDQTNVDFYKVVKLVGKSMVELIGIRSAHVDDTDEAHGMACKVIPLPDHEYGKPFKKKASSSNRISMTSFSSASLWDGKPEYKSWYA